MNQEQFRQMYHDEQMAYLHWAAMSLPLPPLSTEEIEKRVRDEEVRQELKARLKRRYPRLKWTGE